MDINGEEIIVELDICNIDNSSIYNVHYLRSFDPDVDADEHGQYRTTNEIISQKSEGYEYSRVCATGPETQSVICLSSSEPGSVAATFGFSNNNAFSVLFHHRIQPVGTSITSDSAISLMVPVKDVLQPP